MRTVRATPKAWGNRRKNNPKSPVDDELVTLDNEAIQAGMSSKGGYNKLQLEILGVNWPPRYGWKAELIGTQISTTDYVQFLELKGRQRSKHCVRNHSV